MNRFLAYNGNILSLALPCGENMVYDAEMSGCPASCVDLNSEKQCDQPPTEGCRCKDGFVLSDNKCVKKEKCGCKGADSKYYPVCNSFNLQKKFLELHMVYFC